MIINIVINFLVIITIITILISMVRLGELEQRVEQLEQKSVHVAYRHLQEPFIISRKHCQRHNGPRVLHL